MEQQKKVLKTDPLFLIGIAFLIGGGALLTYGFIPQQQSVYTFVASMQVPISDSQGNFVLSPETYFRQNYNGQGSLDQVVCTQNPAGYICYGYQFTGVKFVSSDNAKLYGLGMIAVGAFSTVASKRLGPLRPRVSLARPIRVRVDEDICVANGVCIALAPTVFQFKKQDNPTIFAPMAYVVDPNGADYNTILNAAEMCPTGAVIIEDEVTGERIHPPPPKG